MVHRQGLKLVRLMMVLSSISPLFILLAITGIDFISDFYLITACVLVIVIPNIVLICRIRSARKGNDTRVLVIEKIENHDSYLFTYLFSILLPFYRSDIENCRDLSAMIVALLFIIFLFFYLNLHYINILFAIFGYRIFNISHFENGNPYAGKLPFVIITHRMYVTQNDKITAYRLSDTVYVEKKYES